MAATSDGSAEVAGENALGLLSFSIMQPLERMAQQIEAYRKAQLRAKPLTDVATNKVAAYTLVHCADSMAQAEAERHLEVGGVVVPEPRPVHDRLGARAPLASRSRTRSSR